MAAHVALAAFLYALLTVVRAPAVWGIGRRPDGSNPWAAVEPRISANLSNQFEWPLFFHAACLILLQLQPTAAAVVLAWFFVAGRVLHSAVQLLTRDVRLRGMVFMVNFLAVLGLWVVVVLAAGNRAVAGSSINPRFHHFVQGHYWCSTGLRNGPLRDSLTQTVDRVKHTGRLIAMLSQ